MLNKTKKHFGFTLAETLVTLGIIGVIAALTIPSVYVNYKRNQYYASFTKAYSSLSAVMDTAIAKHGGLTRWGVQANSTVNKTIVEQNILPELQIMQTCQSASACGVNNSLKVRALNASDSISYAESFWNSESVVVILKDGVLLQLHLSEIPLVGLMFDTNGIEPPNTIGRDIFFMQFQKKEGDSDYTLRDASGADNIEDLKGSNSSKNCSTSTSSLGWGCGNRLLIERDMKY